MLDLVTGFIEGVMLSIIIVSAVFIVGFVVERKRHDRRNP